MTQQPGSERNRDVLERFNEILTSGDYDALDDVLDPGFVQELPQSSERVVGIRNFRKILENYPKPPSSADSRSAIVVENDPHVVGEQPHYVMTPTFNVVKVEGSGDELTSYVKARYPDGSAWYIISFTSFRAGRIACRTDFYAAITDAPAWRSAWVE